MADDAVHGPNWLEITDLEGDRMIVRLYGNRPGTIEKPGAIVIDGWNDNKYTEFLFDKDQAVTIANHLLKLAGGVDWKAPPTNVTPFPTFSEPPVEQPMLNNTKPRCQGCGFEEPVGTLTESVSVVPLLGKGVRCELCVHFLDGSKEEYLIATATNHIRKDLQGLALMVQAVFDEVGNRAGSVCVKEPPSRQAMFDAHIKEARDAFYSALGSVTEPSGRMIIMPPFAKCMYCEQTICIDDLEICVEGKVWSCKNIRNCRSTVADTLSEHRDAMGTLEARYNELKGFIVDKLSTHIHWCNEEKLWDYDRRGEACRFPTGSSRVFEEALVGLLTQWRESLRRKKPNV